MSTTVAGTPALMGRIHAYTDDSLTVEQFNVEWKRIHDEYNQKRDEMLYKLMDDRESLRRRVRGLIG